LQAVLFMENLMSKAAPVLAALALFAFTTLCSAQTQLVGEWSGTLSTPAGVAHILWHVVKTADGSVTSTYDNVDEGILGIKVKTLTLNGSEVSAVVDDVIHPNGQDLPLAGSYSGKLSKDGSEVSGTWTQTKPEEQPATDITFKREQTAPPAASPQQTPQTMKE
jgi:hypothetical protein